MLIKQLYADPLIPYLPELIERGKVIYPIGKEKLSFISLDNSAKALAKLAATPSLRDSEQSYLLSQLENYNYAMVELSEIMSEVTGEKIAYQPVTLTKFAEIYPDDGDELASMYHGGALEMLRATTDDFERITGEMRTFLSKHYKG